MTRPPPVRQVEIDQNDERDQDVEKKLYTEDPHCLVAGQPLTEFDLYPSVAVNLRKYGIRCEPDRSRPEWTGADRNGPDRTGPGAPAVAPATAGSAEEQRGLGAAGAAEAIGGVFVYFVKIFFVDRLAKTLRPIGKLRPSGGTKKLKLRIFA